MSKESVMSMLEDSASHAALKRRRLDFDPEPPNLENFALSQIPLLAVVDHGMDPAKPGYVAAAFIDQAGHVVTARHNVANGVARIIFPFDRSEAVMSFKFSPPDTAISVEVVGRHNVLPYGSPTRGERLACVWLRHMGGYVYLPCTMWGENVGKVTQNGEMFWGMRRAGVEPHLGDSGTMFISLGRTGKPTPTRIVGTLHGELLNNIAVFSPIVEPEVLQK